MLHRVRLAFRHLLRNKLYAAINVIGLSTGIACVLLAILYWKDEESFDRFHKNIPNLYRITTSLEDSKTHERVTSGGTGQVQGPAFKAAVPEIEDYVRVMGADIYGDVVAGDKAFHLQLMFADESFFKVFSFDVLRGDPKTALHDISGAVITETVARKLFNSIDVVGRQLNLDADPSAKRLGRPLQVTAVVKNIPANSSIRFEVLLPMEFLRLSFADDNWLNAYLGTFVVLKPGADTKKTLQKFAAVYNAQAGQQVAQSKITYGYDPKIQYGLQPMTSVHAQVLNHNGDAAGSVSNSNSSVFGLLLLGIAIFILLMASINFINIAIAGSLKRSKEVGVRKIIGGSRWQIIAQFMEESAILCTIAFVCSLMLLTIALPVFNSLTNKQIELLPAIDTTLVLYFLLLLAGIVLLTGFYPAYALSSFRPAEVLYNKQKTSGRNILAKSLVVLQFCFAVFFGICTMVYYRQMNFIQNRDLGYNPHQVIRTQIPGNRDLLPVYRYLKNEIAAVSSIKMISFGGGQSAYPVTWENHSIDAVYTVIDEHYLPLLEIPLMIGRNLAPVEFPTDSSRAVIVNEAFVRVAGLQHPLGAQVKTDENFGKEPKTIIGVVKDYHSGSLREAIKPVVLFMNNTYGSDVWVKLDRANLQSGLISFEKIYHKAMSGAVYSYEFLDEANANQYVLEQRGKTIISIATALSIVICCLGLFGLSHLLTQRRVKEIGIRKVLGASVAHIIHIIARNYLQLVILAFIVAAPVAWLVMNKWLQNFAYRVGLSWWLFAIAALLAVGIAFITISFQAIKAAWADPVESLRSE